ncbi:hypothetical protein T03_4865, partial [Trichinella britovi]
MNIVERQVIARERGFHVVRNTTTLYYIQKLITRKTDRPKISIPNSCCRRKDAKVGCDPTTGRRSTLLQTARARLHVSNGNSVVVNCLFDSGSQRSFVQKSVADALSLEGPMERVFIESLGGDHNKCKRTRRVKFWISSLNGKDIEKQLVEALCLPKICQKPKLAPNVHCLKHLTALQLVDDFTGNSGAFDVLIGLDYYYEFVDHKIKRGKKGEPVA